MNPQAAGGRHEGDEVRRGRGPRVHPLPPGRHGRPAGVGRPGRRGPGPQGLGQEGRPAGVREGGQEVACRPLHINEVMWKNPVIRQG